VVDVVAIRVIADDGVTPLDRHSKSRTEASVAEGEGFEPRGGGSDAAAVFKFVLGSFGRRL
jgi:hypothetical protein